MTSWFRSWHGAPTDNKWLVIAAKAQVKPAIVSAVAWALFDYASQADDRGSVADFDTETYAVFSGVAESEVQAIIAAMYAKGVITENGRLHAWDKRQPKREDDSADRVREWRKRKAGNESNGDGGSNNGVTQCNAEKRSVTHGNNTEQNRTDTEQKVVVVVAPPPPAEPAPAESATSAPTKDAATAAVYRCWQDNIPGTLTTVIADDLGDLIDTYGPDAVTRAIGESARANIRTMRYISGILKNWAAGSTKQRASPTNGTSPINGRGNSKVAQSLASVETVRQMYRQQKEAKQ